MQITTTMGPLDALWHLLNFFYPAASVAALAAAAAKGLWRRELAALPWWRLAWPAALASAAVLVAGLLFHGTDGKMGTYVAMLLACAVTLWWRAFFRR
jgi:hypothetical protein